MIAKVRIAPVERWCRRYREKNPAGTAMKEIEIDTRTMQPCSLSAFCGEEWRCWAVTPHSIQEALSMGASVIEGQAYVACESTLEMD
jgi:hypothetical protein